MLYFYVIAKNLKFEPPAFVVVALCYQKVEKHFQYTAWSNVINVNEAIFLYLLKKFDFSIWSKPNNKPKEI